MALIAIEEHWNLPELTSAVKALAETAAAVLGRLPVPAAGQDGHREVPHRVPTDEDLDKFTAGGACSLFGIDITSRKEQR